MTLLVALNVEAEKPFYYLQDPRLLTIKKSAMQDLVDVFNTRDVLVLNNTKFFIAISIIGSAYLLSNKIHFNIEAKDSARKSLMSAVFELDITSCFEENDIFDYDKETITLHRICQKTKDSFRVIACF